MPLMPALRHVLVAAALLAPLPLAAQSPGVLPVVLQTPASVRSMALGDAYMMNSNHADALFYHPALLTRAGGFGLEVQRWEGESSATAASAATSWLGGGIAIGLLSLQYGGPATLAAAAPGGQDHLFATGVVPVSERVAVLGYAREILGVDVGVAGKLLDEGMDRDTEALFDVSLSTGVGPLTVGLTARDFGREPLVDAGGEGPSRIVLGAGAYGQEVGIFDVGLTGALSYSDAETVVSGGVEVGYWPINGRTFVARAGLQQVPSGGAASPFSFGFAFHGDDLVLEWAYRSFGDIDSGTHRFGVRWR